MLYSKQQLAEERKKGLVLSDHENENHPPHIGRTIKDSQGFEEYLSTRSWRQEVKDYHRKQFSIYGVLEFYTDGSVGYPV